MRWGNDLYANIQIPNPTIVQCIWFFCLTFANSHERKTWPENWGNSKVEFLSCCAHLRLNEFLYFLSLLIHGSRKCSWRIWESHTIKIERFTKYTNQLLCCIVHIQEICIRKWLVEMNIIWLWEKYGFIKSKWHITAFFWWQTWLIDDSRDVDG